MKQSPRRGERSTSRGSSAARGLALGGALLVAAAVAPAQSVLAPTPDTGSGPEYRPDAASTSQLWQPGDPGERLHLRGRVLGTSGRPLAGATVEIWQADGAGSYHADRYRAKLTTNAAGEFAIATALPGARYWARHIHIAVSHPAHEAIATRIQFRGDAAAGAAPDDPLAIVLEETRAGDEKVLVGGVQIVLRERRGN